MTAALANKGAEAAARGGIRKPFKSHLGLTIVGAGGRGRPGLGSIVVGFVEMEGASSYFGSCRFIKGRTDGKREEEGVWMWMCEGARHEGVVYSTHSVLYP